MLSNWGNNKPPLGARLNASHPLVKGLVGCWLMNENGGGKLYDLSGKNNTGTITNATWSTSGQIGNTLSFDGDGDYVNIASPSNLAMGTGNWSACAWFKVNAFTNNWPGIIVFDNDGIAFDGDFLAILQDGNGYSMPGGHESIGVWTHVCAVRAGTNYSLYRNGIYGSTIQTESGYGLAGVYHLGTGFSNTSFNGLIDDVMIYDRALTPSRIKQLYTNPFCMFNKPLRRNVYVSSTPPAGKNMRLNIGDSWKDVADLKINVGDSWRSVTSVKQNVGDSWRSVF
jgi:hypothetical protein